MTVAIGAISAAALLLPEVARPTVALLALHGLLLLVLGETVEDQLGHVRHLGLLGATAMAAMYAGGAPAVLPSVLAAVMGAHVTLFPTSRLLVHCGVQVAEIPAYLVSGFWLFAMTVKGESLPLIIASTLLGAVSARRLRLPTRARWAHFDQLP